MRKLALFFAFALVLAACGGSEDTADQPATAAPAADVGAVTEEPASDDHADEPAEHDDGEADHDDDDHATEETGHSDGATAPADRTVEVILAEFAFEPADFQVAAGETIEFVITNTGVVEHEFRLSNEHRIAEHIAAGHADHDDDAAMGHHENGDYMVLVEPGETRSATITFGDDTTLFTEVACLIPGHYEAGMNAPLDYST